MYLVAGPEYNVFCFGVILGGFFFGTFAILEKTGSITLQTFQYLLVIY